MMARTSPSQCLTVPAWRAAPHALTLARGLLGVVRHRNYQHHNDHHIPRTKIRIPSAVKERVIVGQDGTMWRMQAGRRHKRYKKSSSRLRSLKGLVPLARAHAAKLRKLGYKRRWWFHLPA